MAESTSDQIKRLLNGVDMNRRIATLFILDNLIWPVLVIAFVGFTLLLPDLFSTQQNIIFLLYSSAALSALVLAEALCLLSGNFDLSVGSIAGFSAMATAFILTNWLEGAPGIVGIFIILLIGATIGGLNGISVAKFGVNPFLQTLAFFIIFRGAVQVISTSSITGLPATYTYIGGEQIGGIPIAIVVMMILFLLVWFWLKYTRSGQAIYAVGGNEKAASEAGINTDYIIILVFVLSGIFSAFGGLLYTGFLSSAAPTIAQNAVFPAFAAVVIGGISLFGGRGNILGAIGGVLLLGTIQAGLTMLQVDVNIVRMVNGLILLGAVLLYTSAEQYRQRLLSS